MKRQDERAIRYWAKGRYQKLSSDVLRFSPLELYHAGQLAAIRRKTLAGDTFIIVDAVLKRELDFGLDDPMKVFGISRWQLLILLDAFKKFDACRKIKKAKWEDIKKARDAIEVVRAKIVRRDEFFSEEQDALRAALSLMNHRYEALVTRENNLPSFPFNQGDRCNSRVALFHNFDDAVLMKLKHDNVKVFEL